MIESDYEDARTLRRRIEAMEGWLKKPELLQPDADAEYAQIIEEECTTQFPVKLGHAWSCPAAESVLDFV